MGMNMMLTIFSFILFGTLLVANNNLVTNTSQLSTENELTLTSFALAQSIIDEAKTKAFDENTISTEVADSTFMTSTLGNEGGETLSSPPDTLASGGYWSTLHFDDVDDYNSYTRIVKTTRMERDTLSVVVSYTSRSNPGVTISGPSYFKKMVVTVKSPYISRPYSLSYLFSY